MLRHSYITPKACVQKSGISGKGVFAQKPISKGEIISIWGGCIVDKKKLCQMARKNFKDIWDYATPVAEGYFLVSEHKKRLLEDDDYFNHSCQPNAGIKGHILMVAMRDIKAGEEITYDYAMTDAGFRYRFRCCCGKESCRKIITSEDWKNPFLQKRYKGYFSWFVQEKINRLKS